MSRGLDGEQIVIRPGVPEAGLICSVKHFARSIECAVSPVLVIDSTLETVAERCDVKLLIVAEMALMALCESVERVRRAGYSESLLAVATDSDPAAIERVVTAGANDYVSVPDRIAELPYRALALLRRKSGFWSQNLASISPRKKFVEPEAAEPLFREVRLDPNLRTALVGGHQVVLTLREFLMLQYLRSRPSIWISATELLSEVCGCPAQGDSTRVRVHMSSMRKKLGTHRNLVESRRTYGYRWVGSSDEER